MFKWTPIAILLILMSCGVSPDDDYGLYYKGDNPLVLVKGDTSLALEFKRIGIIGPQGKMQTDDNYQNVNLSHGRPDDTTMLKILELRLLALDTTSDKGIVIKAADMESNYTARLHVKVVLP